MKRCIIIGLCIILAGLAFLVGFESRQMERREILAMDTVMELKAWGRNSPAALDNLEREIRSMEQKFSRTIDSSMVSRLNHASENPMRIDSDFMKLLTASREYNLKTEGAFDITVAPIADLWGFTKESFQIPSEESIRTAMKSVGMGHLRLDGNLLFADAGTQIDLGGILKGFLAEKADSILQGYRVENGLVNLGGDILAKGRRPDGKAWVAGIRNPLQKEENASVIGTVELQDRYIFTSGNYERYFDRNGVRYCHIIDPKTGAPADSDLVSVTVAADIKPGGGMMCDALSTALFVMGSEGAETYWKEHRDAFEMILLKKDGEIIFTKGMEGTFHPYDDSLPWTMIA